MTENPSQIIMYGTTWCYDSKKARNILETNQIPFTFINIDEDMEGRRFVEKVNNGNRSVPTIVFPDGSMLVEPSSMELKEKLGLVQN